MADTAHDKRMELTEHLGELRSRIIRSIWYLVICSIIGYILFPSLYAFAYTPLEKEMTRLNIAHVANSIKSQEDEQKNKTGIASKEAPVALILPPLAESGKPITAEQFNELRAAIDWLYRHPVNVPTMNNVFTSFHEMFMVRLKVGIIFGFILAVPLIIWELAMFVTPALTLQERKPLRLLIPLSIVLMLLGMTVAYRTLFYAMPWFLSFLNDFPSGAVLMQNPNEYFVFFMQMMAAFGIAFQLPVVLMGGAYLGLISSKGLAKNWKWGIVLAALGGLFTPSNDLPSMALMAIPLLILYFGSIYLVRFVEHIKAREKKKPA